MRFCKHTRFTHESIRYTYTLTKCALARVRINPSVNSVTEVHESTKEKEHKNLACARIPFCGCLRWPTIQVGAYLAWTGSLLLLRSPRRETAGLSVPCTVDSDRGRGRRSTPTAILFLRAITSTPHLGRAPERTPVALSALSEGARQRVEAQEAASTAKHGSPDLHRAGVFVGGSGRQRRHTKACFHVSEASWGGAGAPLGQCQKTHVRLIFPARYSTVYLCLPRLL